MYAPTRTLLSATFIVSALMPAALASAADFPLPPPLPAWTWAGFYIGGQIGGFGGTSTFSDPYGPSVFGDKVTTNGFLAGLQLGYDWQVAPKWVVGVVADTSYLDGRGSFTCMQAAATIIGSNCEVTTRALATMAGRVGFLVDPLNHTLVYGKAGGAWTDSHVSIHPGNAPFGDFPGAEFPGAATSANANAWGGMIGAGLEHALTPAWSISFEYNYYRFASANVSTPQTISATRTVPPAFTVDPSITSGVTADMQVVKLALNYHWGEDLAAAWTYAPAFAIAAMPVTAQPAFLAKGWAFESGARYWYSTGTSKNTSGGGTLLSRLTYDNLTGQSGEFFARVDTPAEVFVKGFVGAGAITGGKMNDEDWGLVEEIDPEEKTKVPTAFEVTGSSVAGWLKYAAGDVGYNVWHAHDYKVGPFVGYSYFHQTMNAFGCVQLTTPESVCSTPIPANQTIITQDDTWQALRVGVSAVATIWDRWGINGDVAYLPYAQFGGLDTHWQRNPVAFYPQDGTGRGVQAELILTYRITENLNVGIGGRYWAFWSTNANQSCHGGCDLTAPSGTFSTIPPSPFTTSTQRYGTFVQASYRFGSAP